MRAVTWNGKRDVRVEEVPDPRLVAPTDAIVRITSTAIRICICTSNKRHLHEQQKTDGCIKVVLAP